MTSSIRAPSRPDATRVEKQVGGETKVYWVTFSTVKADGTHTPYKPAGCDFSAAANKAVEIFNRLKPAEASEATFTLTGKFPNITQHARNRNTDIERVSAVFFNKNNDEVPPKTDLTVESQTDELKWMIDRVDQDLIETTSDGTCLDRSIAHQINPNRASELAKQLRERVVNHIESNPSWVDVNGNYPALVASIIAMNNSEKTDIVKEFLASKPTVSEHHDAQERDILRQFYVEHLRTKPNAYLDVAFLAALSQMGLNIVVLEDNDQASGPRFKVSIPFTSNDSPLLTPEENLRESDRSKKWIYVWFNGTNHYKSMNLKSEELTNAISASKGSTPPSTAVAPPLETVVHVKEETSPEHPPEAAAASAAGAPPEPAAAALRPATPAPREESVSEAAPPLPLEEITKPQIDELNDIARSSDLDLWTNLSKTKDLLERFKNWYYFKEKDHVPADNEDTDWAGTQIGRMVPDEQKRIFREFIAAVEAATASPVTLDLDGSASA